MAEKSSNGGRLIIWVLGAVGCIAAYGVVQGAGHQLRFGHTGTIERMRNLENKIEDMNEVLVQNHDLLITLAAQDEQSP